MIVVPAASNLVSPSPPTPPTGRSPAFHTLPRPSVVLIMMLSIIVHDSVFFCIFLQSCYFVSRFQKSLGGLELHLWLVLINTITVALQSQAADYEGAFR